MVDLVEWSLGAFAKHFEFLPLFSSSVQADHLEELVLFKKLKISDVINMSIPRAVFHGRVESPDDYKLKPQT